MSAVPPLTLAFLQRARGWLTQHSWLFVPILAARALSPFLTEGVRLSQDIAAHLPRLASLDYSLRHGVLYPRWTPEFNLGNGYPVLGYYGPLSYYVAEGLRLLGLRNDFRVRLRRRFGLLVAVQIRANRLIV